MSARRMAAASLVALLAGLGLSLAAAPRDRRPDALVDLRTEEGVRLVGGAWRYHDARVVEIDSRGPGPDLRASGAPVRTLDLVPKAGVAGFDDSGWEIVPPGDLEARRSSGRLSFGWYRISLTVPAKVGRFDPSGSTAVFEIVVDDYAEVWVDGALPRSLGQVGGSLVGGFNAPNRVVLGRDVRPGQTFQVAVLAANGPLSDPPANFLWIRSATLEFLRDAQAGEEVPFTVVRNDPALDAAVPAGARLERLADGFRFGEGPVWIPEGYLLFSDPNANRIYRWSPDDGVSVFRTKSGYSGADIADYAQPGSNGLALDPDGRLTVAQHGNRRVVRIEKNGVTTVLADRYEGKRLNSPNDLTYRSDGTLYFTDPPFGLPRVYDDPEKELPFSGVFRLHDGRLTLESTDLLGPNGLALSPDEKQLYVGNWDTSRKIVMRYDVAADGSLSGGMVFFDMTGAPGEEALDGLKVDSSGNVYVSGPGGVWILSSGGRHLGTIQGPELPANFAFGDDDGRTLYLTARTGLYRMRLGNPGAAAVASLR